MEASLRRTVGRLLAAFAALLLAVTAFAPGTVFADDGASAAGGTAVEVTTFEELKNAIEGGGAESSDLVITALNNIAFEGTITVPAGQRVTVAGADEDTAFSWSEGSRGSRFFTVDAGASLTLDVNMDAAHLDPGAGTQHNGLFAKVAGDLTITGGTYQNAAVSASHAGAFYVAGDGASMTLKDGVITKNTNSNQICGTIYLDDGASLSIEGGLITENDAMTDPGQANNAPVYVDGTGGCTVEMSGGTISNNHGDFGGIFVGERSLSYLDYTHQSSVTMTGGSITGNTAESSGGGVAVWACGNFYFKGGEITGNKAPIGGGVAATDLYVAYLDALDKQGNADKAVSVDSWGSDYNCPGRFEMTGGEISGNTAYLTDDPSVGCGGGVYIASNTSSIFAGTISNNVAERQGGGIYIGSTPYVLHMKDVLVTGNSASILGGGMWLCPTGSAHTSVSNGALISGNTAASSDGSAAGDDIVSVQSNDSSSEQGLLTLSNRALGGGSANWYEDGGVTTLVPGGDGETSVLGFATDDPRYTGPDSTASRSDISDSAELLALKSVASDETMQLASQLAKVIVTGNSAPRGGGIGNNGSIVIGPNRNPEDDEPTWNLVVEKAWDEGVAESDRQPVTVDLQIGDYVLDGVELNEENGWTASFSELPDPSTLGDLKVGVVEEGDTYAVSYGELQMDEENHVMTVVVTNAMPQATSVDITAEKVLDGATLTAGQFEFQLKDEAGNVIATAANEADGSVTFKAVPITEPHDYNFTISEVDDGQDGYTYDDSEYPVTVKVTVEDGKLVATVTSAAPTFENVYKEPEQPTPSPTPATPAKVTISATKVLQGADLEDGEFTFQLVDEDGNVVATATNDGDGKVTFPAMSFDAEGDHTYVVSEVLPADDDAETSGVQKDGITYDQASYKVTVNVTKDGDAYAAKVTGDGATFTNVYTKKAETPTPTPEPTPTPTPTPEPTPNPTPEPTPNPTPTPEPTPTPTPEPASTTVTVGGKKELQGASLKAGKFSFELKDENGTVLATVANAADGTFAFPSLTYTDAGTYRYTLDEVNDGQQGVTYDDTVYDIAVTVTDDGAGALTAQYTVQKHGESTYLTDLPTFVNVYTPAAGETPAQTPAQTAQPSSGPSLPGTGDMAPFAVGCLVVAGAALIGVATYVKKRRA